MINWIAAAFLVVGFVILARLFKLPEKSRRVIAIARDSLAVVRNSTLSDEHKEESLQSNAKQLLRLFGILLIGGVGAVVLPFGVVWLGDLAGLLSQESVLTIALSPTFLIISVMVGCIGLFGFSASPSGSGYSAGDRLMHHIAFSTYSAQATLADLEDRVFAKRLASVHSQKPVFITSLPRAGTTILLESFVKVPEFASHTYRDMPFVLIPCLWNQFTCAFRQSGDKQERAHGDGMLIDFDSPEAFEEIIWHTFWKSQYRADRIVPWTDKPNEEFAEFFSNHMRKIVWLRHGERAAERRYVSKNNLNIARVPLVKQLFPDATILIPFRNPMHHAASLSEQHLNFLQIHREDRFASTYMRAIGHYDFGDNLRPIDFGGWMDRNEPHDPTTLSFWLRYWVETFKALIAHGEIGHVVFVSYEQLCEQPRQCLKRIAEVVDCREPDALVATSSAFRPVKKRHVDISDVAATLLAEVDEVYDRLQSASLNTSSHAVITS